MSRKWLVLIFLLPFMAVGQKSPFNGLTPQIDSGQTNYTFLVSAHFYGGDHTRSGFPAATVLANLDTINESEAAFLVCSGDLFQDIRNNIPNFRRSLFDKLQIPLYNAVGNHDLSDDIYQQNFGSTWHSFTVVDDQVIVLDTELNSSSIKGDQLNFLKDQVSSANPSGNLFIFSHRPIWAEARSDLQGVFPDNTQSVTGSNYLSDIEPLLEKHAGNVYWFSGSMGGQAPASFFYHHPEGTNLHFIQNAVRDLPRDGMLFVNVNKGEVSFEPWSLTGQELQSLETYNLDYWEREEPADSGINWRLLPLYTWQMVSGWHFWIGVVFALLGSSILRWVIRKWKKKRAGN